MERMMEQERKQVMPWKVKELKRDQNGKKKKRREREKLTRILTKRRNWKLENRSKGRQNEDERWKNERATGIRSNWARVRVYEVLNSFNCVNDNWHMNHAFGCSMSLGVRSTQATFRAYACTHRHYYAYNAK